MDASEPKCVNSISDTIGVYSLRVGSLPIANSSLLATSKYNVKCFWIRAIISIQFLLL